MPQYKGYVGEAAIDWTLGLIRGKVTNADVDLSFRGSSVDGAAREFREAVDEYLTTCERDGKPAAKPRDVK